MFGGGTALRTKYFGEVQKGTSKKRCNQKGNQVFNIGYSVGKGKLCRHKKTPKVIKKEEEPPAETKRERRGSKEQLR